MKCKRVTKLSLNIKYNISNIDITTTAVVVKVLTDRICRFTQKHMKLHILAANTTNPRNAMVKCVNIYTTNTELLHLIAIIYKIDINKIKKRFWPLTPL